LLGQLLSRCFMTRRYDEKYIGKQVFKAFYNTTEVTVHGTGCTHGKSLNGQAGYSHVSNHRLINPQLGINAVNIPCDSLILHVDAFHKSITLHDARSTSRPPYFQRLPAPPLLRPLCHPPPSQPMLSLLGHRTI